MLDTLRAENLSLYGYERLTTPHIDRFAKRGVYFRNAISVGGNTTTAMAGIMTGHSPFFEFGSKWTGRNMFGMNRFYRHSKERGLPASLDSLAQRLKRSGYMTVGMITNPNLKRVFNFDRGFDSYEEIFAGNRFGPATRVSSSAVRFLTFELNRPFFLYLHYMDVHGPYNPPAAYRSCLGTTWPNATFNVQRWVIWEAVTKKSPKDVPKLYRHMTDLYDCSLRYLDDQVNRVLMALREQDLLKETIVVITSDHGEEFLEHGETGHQGQLYGELLRVPLIIHVPGQEPGEIVPLVRNFDLMPTLLELAGVEHDAGEFDAMSLRPLLSGSTKVLPRHVFANFPMLRMYRDSRYKILEGVNGHMRVFDLLSDPGELDPLRGQAIRVPRVNALRTAYLETVQSLESRYGDRFPVENDNTVSTGDPLKVRQLDLKDVDQTTRDQLRELGYVE